MFAEKLNNIFNCLQLIFIVEFGFLQSEFTGEERVEQYTVPLVFFSGNIRSGRGFIVNTNLIPGTAS